MAGLFLRGARAVASADRGDPAQEPLNPIEPGDIKRRVELLDSFEAAGLGWFWASDAQGRVIYFSESAAARLGLDHGEVIGRALSDLFVPEAEEDAEQPQRPLAFLLRARNSITRLPVRVKTPDGDAWWEVAGKPQLDSRERFIGYRGSAKDITTSRQKLNDAERLAEYDPLTGLANRHRMTQRLGKTLASYRNAKRSCALITLDLDRFKQVNDTLGHQAGDELLKQVGSRIERIVGKRGEIGRLGGDEFQVILPDMDDRGALGELASQLLQMVSQPYSINGSRAIVGSSAGVAIAPYDGLEAEELIRAADLALYSAKGGGRARYRFYTSDLQDGARQRRETEESLRDALANDQLEMHYQPIVDAKTRKLTGMEALMRWHHPERGDIEPGVFIPVAEEIGIIDQLGGWALSEACRQAAEWPVELQLSVNVSSIQFAQEDFPQTVRRALESSRLAPARLELEVTEGVFLGDTGHAQDVFAELKKIGVGLTLDDFGTGYSSLSYLRSAPFSRIKIDQSFVQGAAEDGNNNAAILSAIVGLANALGMQTVAEGVESKDELELVCRLGASHVQGFIFARAMPQADVLERLRSEELQYEARGPAKQRAERRTMFRRIGLIHEDHRYKAVMRNLSKTGAMIEGVVDVPVGTLLVLDLGGGQLAVATVRRSSGQVQGVEFETPLISDGDDGLCTRHRVSPYEIEAVGKPLAALPDDAYSLIAGTAHNSDGEKKFAEVEVGPPRAIRGSSSASPLG